MTSAGPCTVIDRLTEAVWGTGTPESVAVNVKGNVPTFVGVPVIAPVAVLKMRPAEAAGRGGPGDRCGAAGGAGGDSLVGDADLSVRRARDGFDGETGGDRDRQVDFGRQVRGRGRVSPVTVKVVSPPAVGVPVMTPAVLRLRPAGSFRC